MAKGINDIGNGYGWLYETLPDGTTITAVDGNTNDGARNFKRMAVTNAPLSSNRSAIATITVTGCAGAGDITSILINGVNQLGAPLAVVTAVNATLAASIAAAINAFTPGSGTKQTAYAIGAVVYVVTPPESGAALNGQAITVAASDITTTTTTTTFVNGATSAGVYDSEFGRRYYIDADYGAAGIVGSAPADPSVLTYAFEITEYLTQRGMQAGIPLLNPTLATDTLVASNRYSSVMAYAISGQAGAADVLAQINAAKFIDGDLIILSAYDIAAAITVESAPVTTSTAATPNIYLSGNVPFVLDGITKQLMLAYKYDATLGAIFTELSRSGTNANVIIGGANLGAGTGLVFKDAASNILNFRTILQGAGMKVTVVGDTILLDSDVKVGNSLFVSKTWGNNTTAARESLSLQFLTITAAVTAAQSGDTIFVFPGTYNDNNIQKDGVTVHLFEGARIVATGGSVVEVNTAITFKVTGNGYIEGNLYSIVVNNTSAIVEIECDEVMTPALGVGVYRATGSLRLKAKNKINVGIGAFGVDIRGAGDCYISTPEISDIATTDSDRNNNAYGNIAIRSVTGGNIVIESPTIKGRTRGPILLLQDTTGANSINVKYDRMQNDWTGATSYNTCSVLLLNTGLSESTNNVFIYGNILSTGTSGGIYALFNPSTGKVNYFGNVQVQGDTYAILNASNAYFISFNGDAMSSSATTNAIRIGDNNAGLNRSAGGIFYFKGKAVGAIPPVYLGWDGILPFAVTFDSARLIDQSLTNSISSASAGAAQDVRYYNNVMANVVASLTGGTNLITGTSLLVDTDVIY